MNLENKVFSITGHQTGMAFAFIGRACFILPVLSKIIVNFIKDIICKSLSFLNLWYPKGRLNQDLKEGR